MPLSSTEFEETLRVHVGVGCQGQTVQQNSLLPATALDRDPVRDPVALIPVPGAAETRGNRRIRDPETLPRSPEAVTLLEVDVGGAQLLREGKVRRNPGVSRDFYRRISGTRLRGGRPGDGVELAELD